MNFYNNILKLDNILIKEHISNKDIVSIQKLIQNNSVAIYFWRNLDKWKWFPLLKEAGFFRLLSLSFNYDDSRYRIQAFICGYLKIVSDKYPSEVVDILKSATHDNETLIRDFVDIGMSLPPKYTSKIVSLVKKWGVNRTLLTSSHFGHEIIGWINYLIAGGERQAALRLIKIIVNPRAIQVSKGIERKTSKMLELNKYKASALIDNYYLKEMLTKGIDEVIKFNPLELSNILAHSLEKAINIEYSHLKGKHDLSYIWRPAIENHSQNYEHYDTVEILLISLRDTLQNIVSNKSDHAISIINNYLTHKYSIFRRLAFHLLRLYSDQYWDIIEIISNNKQLLNEIDISHEYYLLLRDNFLKFTDRKKDFIVNSILSLNNCDSNVSSEIQEKQKRYDWFIKLHFFEKDLNNSTKQVFEDLKREFQAENIRDTATWHESYYGEKSPLTIEELNSKDIRDIWKLFKDFDIIKPKFGTPSVDGLARTFGEIVKLSPEKYLLEDLTPLLDLRPNYSYWLMNQVTELFKANDLFKNTEVIKNVLLICSRLMKLQDIPRRFTDDMGINFSSVRKRIIDIIQSLIKVHQEDFPLEFKDDIWIIIEYLCLLESNSLPEWEKDDLETDPVTKSLNTVKGTSMHALIDYALWYAYHTKQNYSGISYPNRFNGEERIQLLLEYKLDKNNDSSLAVHSIYGLFLTNLAYLNRTWLLTNLSKIFPSGEDYREYWKAAWNGYICYSRFYKDIYNLLLPQFSRALDYLAQKEPLISSVGRSSEEALSEHLLIACINGLDDIKKTDSLLKKFAMIPNNNFMSHAVQFISILAKDEKLFITKEDFWEQAKYLWEIRIKVVVKENRKANILNEEEAYDMEFGRYIDWLDDLPSKVTLKEIESLLIETIKINRKGWHLPNIIDYLAYQSAKYPQEAVNLFKQLMCTDAPEHFYYGKEHKIKGILSNAIKHNDNSRNTVESIINKFGEWGNYYLREFWMENFLPSFEVINITLNDIEHHRIRILVDDKKYFPGDDTKQRKRYNIKFIFEKHIFNVLYTIDSKDNKKRSGCLGFEKDDYLKMNLKEGTNLKILILDRNKLYKIIKWESSNKG